MMLRRLFLTAFVAVSAHGQAPRPAVRPAAARPAAAPSPGDLKFPPLRAYEPRAISRFQLANGLKVLLLEDHETPLVTGAAIVRTGTVFDPPERAGLAHLTGVSLRAGGSRLKTPEQLDTELETLGATLDSNIAETMGTVSFSVLKENLTPALAIFRDVLTTPAFRQDRLDRARGAVQNAIAARNGDSREILRREFRTLLHGKESAFGRHAEYASIGAITRADIVRFYRRYFFPANVTLAISGDFDSARMKGALEELFAGWKNDQAPVPAFPTAGIHQSRGGYVAMKPGAKETYLVAGLTTGEQNDKDNAAMDVAAAILGGGGQSRLVQRARAGEASAPDIRAEWSPGYGHPGGFAMSAIAMSTAAGDVAKMIVDELQRLRAAEVTEDELRMARESAVLKFTGGFDNRAKALLAQATYEYYGLPAGFPQQYQKELAAVTRADVLRVAKQRLDPENLTVLAVSNLTVFRTPLDPRGGASTVLDLTIPPPRQEAAKGETATLDQGKQLLLRAQQASGGAANLAAVKDLTRTVVYTVEDGTRDTETDRWIAPSYLRQDGQSGRRGMLAIYTDGTNGWVSNGRASAALTGMVMQQALSELLRTPIALLLSDRVPGRVVNALDEETVEIAQGNTIVRIVMDPQTGLPAKLLYDAPSDKSIPIFIEEDLSGYRDVGGVKLPFVISVTRNGVKYGDGAVTECKLNQGLKVEVLQRRP